MSDQLFLESGTFTLARNQGLLCFLAQVRRQEFWGHRTAFLHCYGTAQLSRVPNCRSSRDEFQGGDMGINGKQLYLQLYYLPRGRFLLLFSTLFLLTSRWRGFLFHKLKFHFVAFLFKISVFSSLLRSLLFASLHSPLFQQELKWIHDLLYPEGLRFPLWTPWGQQLMHLLLCWVLLANKCLAPSGCSKCLLTKNVVQIKQRSFLR